MKQNRIDRNRKRRERYKTEVDNMLKRYASECRDCGTYYLTDEELDEYLNLSYEEKRAYKFNKKKKGDDED